MRIRMAITGTSMLLMSSQRAADPTDPLVKEYKSIYGKRKKTDEDLTQLADLEFMLRIYHSEEMGPYIPAINLKRCIQDGAKRSKQGKVVDEGLQTVKERFKLLYTGPRGLEELQADRNFRDTRLVGVESRLTLRTRPCFSEWGLVAEFNVVPELLSLADVVGYAKQAGALKGLGDYRPEFGKFEVTNIQTLD